MQRYLLVRGKQGMLVANPHTPNDDARYVGQRRKDKLPEFPVGLVDFYEPIEEIVMDHHDLAKPIRKGDLELIDKVGEHNQERAEKHFEERRAVKEKKVTHG